MPPSRSSRRTVPSSATQSPKPPHGSMPGSERMPCGKRYSRKSRYATMPFQRSSRIRRSPKQRWIVQGQITIASAQAGPPSSLESGPLPVSGAMGGTRPSPPWASSRSRSHFEKNPATSMLKEAVRTKTWASPVQPRRSSRCGQSVGRSTKLPRWLQVMLLWSWFRSPSEQAKLPVSGMSEWSTTPVSSWMAPSSRRPATST